MDTALFRQPAEWAPHDAVWLAWPSHADLWLDALPDVQASFAQFARAIARDGGERLEVLCPDDERADVARAALAGTDLRIHRIPFGDIWLRDTAPVFVHDAKGEVVASRFVFNGWGGKYVLPHDADVSEAVAAASGLRSTASSLVLEGGSIEVDGEGSVLTSRQCLLNANRNPGLSEDEIGAQVLRAFGGEALLWVTDGLVNDHTDGHIDTIARFVAPGVVALMEPVADDPNHDVLLRLVEEVRALRDARGRRVEVVTMPSPGRVTDGSGRVMPASHLNFYIGNRAVVVPVYGTAYDDAAGRAVEAWFPGRRVETVQARCVLEGGGAFHCISQQQPSRRAEGAR